MPALADADATALLAIPIRGRAGFAGAAAYPGRWKRAAWPWPTPTPRRCLQSRSEAVPALPARPLTPVAGKDPPGLGRPRPKPSPGRNALPAPAARATAA